MEVEEDMLLLNESLHRFDDRLGEPSIERERVIESSASPFSSRTRENNLVDELDERFLCFLEESNMDPPEMDPSTAPLDQPDFEHDSSEDTMVDYARELTFLPDLTELTLKNLDYGEKNVISSAHDEEQQAKLIDLLKKHKQKMV